MEIPPFYDLFLFGFILTYPFVFEYINFKQKQNAIPGVRRNEFRAATTKRARPSGPGAFRFYLKYGG